MAKRELIATGIATAQDTNGTNVSIRVFYWSTGSVTWEFE